MADAAGGWRRMTLERTSEPAPTAAAVPEAGPAPAPPRHAAATTFVDAGARFEGTLRLRQGFRIDSEFRGAIVSEAVVVVGETADVVADIRAREVVVAGAVAGNISASRCITLRAGGCVCGDLEAPSLEIEKGALFNGRTTMVNPVLAVRARPVPAGIPAGHEAGEDASNPAAGTPTG